METVRLYARSLGTSASRFGAGPGPGPRPQGRGQVDLSPQVIIAFRWAFGGRRGVCCSVVGVVFGGWCCPMFVFFNAAFIRGQHDPLEHLLGQFVSLASMIPSSRRIGHRANHLFSAWVRFGFGCEVVSFRSFVLCLRPGGPPFGGAGELRSGKPKNGIILMDVYGFMVVR